MGSYYEPPPPLILWHITRKWRKRKRAWREGQHIHTTRGGRGEVARLRWHTPRSQSAIAYRVATFQSLI